MTPEEQEIRQSEDWRKLQQRESEIWAELDDVCEEHTLKAISELIEINLELEKLNNL
jgi:hypothetical protein